MMLIHFDKFRYGLATPAKPSRSTLGSSAGKTSTSSPHSTTPYARPRPGPVSSTLNSSPQVEISSPFVLFLPSRLM